MILYHGTHVATATALARNPASVSVSTGGGELGQGFYAIEHVWMAISWAAKRHQKNGKVLEISVDPSQLATLSVRTLNHQEVVNLWNQLRAAGAERTYRMGYDVIFGPLGTYAHLSQEKFESATAEAVLKQAQWRVI